jgi:hypothetical protein
MTPKQRRIVERDVENLFSPKAFISKPTLEDVMRLGFFHPTVKYKRGTLFLSDKGMAAVRRLTDLVYGLDALRDSVSKREIGVQLLKNYNDLLEKHLQPTGQEFIEGVADALLEGLELIDQDSIELGSVRILRSNRALLERVKFEGGLELGSIYEQFKDSIWLIGAIRGSPDVASERFEHRATLTVGLLALYGAVLYKGAVRRSRLRAVISPLEHRKATLILSWERGGENPSLTRSWGHNQNLPLDAKSLAFLTFSIELEFGSGGKIQKPIKKMEWCDLDHTRCLRESTTEILGNLHSTCRRPRTVCFTRSGLLYAMMAPNASGLSDLDTGVRLRYEISRKFAPYIGFAYSGKNGNTFPMSRKSRSLGAPQ